MAGKRVSKKQGPQIGPERSSKIGRENGEALSVEPRAQVHDKVFLMQMLQRIRAKRQEKKNLIG